MTLNQNPSTNTHFLTSKQVQQKATDDIILKLHLSGLSNKEISTKLEKPKTTVSDILKRAKNEDHYHKIKKRGRKVSYSKREEKIVLSDIKSNPFPSCSEIKTNNDFGFPQKQ